MRILITAGGTREYIDSVRFISNASSGKMGVALARCALGRKHHVTLLTASVSLALPAAAQRHQVGSAHDMYEAVKALFPQCDCLIMCAAVSDYTVRKRAQTKLKKTKEALTLKLEPTVDILQWASNNKGMRGKQQKFVCGFALEDENLHENAEKKMAEKHLDMIIANSSAAIGADTSAISVKVPSLAWRDYPAATKTINARRIVRVIEACVRPAEGIE